MLPEDLLPQLRNLYDLDEVFRFDGKPEDLADALFKDSELALRHSWIYGPEYR